MGVAWGALRIVVIPGPATSSGHLPDGNTVSVSISEGCLPFRITLGQYVCRTSAGPPMCKWCKHRSRRPAAKECLGTGEENGLCGTSDWRLRTST